MALVDSQDVADILGRAVSATQLEVATTMAAASIRAYIGQDPDTFIGTRTVWLPVRGDGTVRLPLLTSVVSVTDADSVAVTYTYRAGYTLTVDSLLFDTDLQITYRYATAPAEIRMAALHIVLDILGAQNAAGGLTVGLRSETTSIDDYTRSVTYADGSGTGGLGLPAVAVALLRPFKPGLQSVRIRTT